IQKDAETGKVLGGHTYVVKKGPRELFYAKADRQVSGDNIILTAETLDEPAVYNWYDPDGNLVSSGSEITVDTEVAEKYKLEIIATTDAYKDYRQVYVQDPHGLDDLIPNPATDQVSVHYHVDSQSSSYLMITHSVSGV